jgi:NAD+ diphosphatase
MTHAMSTTLTLAAHLPFNRDCLGVKFVPAKGGTPPAPGRGRWLVVQEQSLVVVSDAATFRLPETADVAAFDGHLGEALWVGTVDDLPCWTARLPKDVAPPPGFVSETLVPMRGTRLPDDLLSLGGMAMQLLWWASTSGFCPRCGAGTTHIAGEWGKRCPRCRYEHYPHLHPAVIVLVKDGDRVLLARKREWSPGRYSLIAGFVDNGECLEGAVRREVKEEVGVDVGELTYVGSQNWPFPSQLMVGFVATYAGGEIVVDREELEDARWFAVDELPEGPSRHSIARFIMDRYARR